MGKVEALLASSVLGLLKEGVPAEVLLWGPGWPSIMLEAALTGRKGRPNGGPVYGRLPRFLEGVIEWKEARNPSLSKTAGHPTV